MEAHARHAVELAKTRFQATLDYGTDSLQVLETLFDRWNMPCRPGVQGDPRLADAVMGQLLGRVIRRRTEANGSSGPTSMARHGPPSRRRHHLYAQQSEKATGARPRTQHLNLLSGRAGQSAPVLILMLALTHVPSPHINEAKRTFAEWEAIDYERALRQHADYCRMWSAVA